MMLNPVKCKEMFVCFKRVPPMIDNITINNVPIERVSTTSSAGLSKKIKLVRNERKGLRTNFPKWWEATNQIIFNISFYQNNIIIKVFNYF
jgi:hypothetical protein